MTFPVQQDYVITNGFRAAHPGVDIAPVPAGKTGVPCVAPESGSIVASGYRVSPEGNYVIMRGDSGRFYYFGHFFSRSVSANQRVSEGQQVGILGMTGAATGVHVHFEVRPTVNPLNQINPLSIKYITTPKEETDVTKKFTSTDQVRKCYESFGIIGTPNAVLQKWVDDGGTDYDLMLGLAPTVQNNLAALNQRLTEAQKGFKLHVGELYEKNV